MRRIVGILTGAILVATRSAGTEPPGSESTIPSTPTGSPAISSPQPRTSTSPVVTSPSPDQRAWQQIGTIATGTDWVWDLVGFEKGYVAIAGPSNDAASTAWFSADGRDWQRVELPFTPQPGELSWSARGLATNGRQVLAVGMYYHEPCFVGATEEDTGYGQPCPSSLISWLTDDGTTWQTGYPGPRPPDPPDHWQGSDFDAAWPVATGGWDAALSFNAGAGGNGRSLWRSPDGSNWTELTPVPVPDTPRAGDDWQHGGVADASGRRVVWQAWVVPDFSDADAPTYTRLTTLSVSADGQTWSSLDSFPGAGVNVGSGVAPSGSARRWVFTGESDVASGSPTHKFIWSSEDLLNWTTTTFDASSCGSAGGIDDLVLTQSGYVAVGWSAENDAACRETWLSEDGAAWTPLPPVGMPDGADLPGLIADGPAGVIGIGGPTVWQLR
jgi:hypothetical protein